MGKGLNHALRGDSSLYAGQPTIGCATVGIISPVLKRGGIGIGYFFQPVDQFELPLHLCDHPRRRRVFAPAIKIGWIIEQLHSPGMLIATAQPLPEGHVASIIVAGHKQRTGIVGLTRRYVWLFIHRAEVITLTDRQIGNGLTIMEPNVFPPGHRVASKYLEHRLWNYRMYSLLYLRTAQQRALIGHQFERPAGHGQNEAL